MTARSTAVLTLLLISPLVRPALAQTADEVVAAVEGLAPAGGPAPGAECATALTGDTR